MKKNKYFIAVCSMFVVSGCATNSTVMSSISQINQEIAALKNNTNTLTQKVDALEQSRIPTGVLAVESGRSNPSGYSGAVVSPKQSGFANSLALFQAGDVNGAISGFETYLQENPNASDAGNAKYWLGTAYYTKQDYQRAQRYLGMFLSTNPNNEKSQEALQKLINSLKALGRDNDARILQEQGISAITAQ